jgi:hypothetical protein
MIRRSVNPKRAKSADDVDELCRNLGRPDPELFGALMEGLNEQDLLAQAALEAPPTPELLHDGTGILLQAYTSWQKLSPDKRSSRLRGCTLQLIALAVDQVRRLQQLHNEQAKRAAEQEEARRRHEALLSEARHICTQAKALLMKVAGNRSATQSALEQGVGEPTTPQELVRSLRYVADMSKNLLTLPASSVRTRAVLFGLSKGFVDSMESLLEQIRQAEQKMNLRLSQVPPDQSVERVRAVVWFLFKHISDVFFMAHQTDPSIPELRPPRGLGPQAKVPPAMPPPQPLDRVVVVAPTKPAIERVRIPPLK